MSEGATSDQWKVWQVPALVDQHGPEVVGRMYAVRTQVHLDLIRTGRAPSIEELDSDPLGWVDDAVAFNDDLDPDVRLRMIVAAAGAAANDDVLYCIGDQPAAHLVAVPGFARRLHAERRSSAAVDHLFHVMQRRYREQGEDNAGWWDDPALS